MIIDRKFNIKILVFSSPVLEPVSQQNQRTTRNSIAATDLSVLVSYNNFIEIHLATNSEQFRHSLQNIDT